MPVKEDVPTVTREDIARGLVALGLKRGDCVVAHSSLSSLGYVERGPAAVVDAVIDAIGPDGTAVFPTYCGSRRKDLSAPIEDSITTGAIPKDARSRDDFLKGVHPFYSICAKGPLAAELIELNDRFIFPAGERKFLYRMSEHGGKVLLLGVGHDSNSSIHLVEELGSLEYKVQDKPFWSLGVKEFLALPGERRLELLRAHRGEGLPYGTAYHFDAMDAVLRRRGLISVARVGAAECRLMTIADIVRVGLEEVKRDPWFLRSKVRSTS